MVPQSLPTCAPHCMDRQDPPRLRFDNIAGFQPAPGKGIARIDYEFGIVCHESIVDSIMICRNQHGIVAGYRFGCQAA